MDFRDHRGGKGFLKSAGFGWAMKISNFTGRFQRLYFMGLLSSWEKAFHKKSRCANKKAKKHNASLIVILVCLACSLLLGIVTPSAF